MAPNKKPHIYKQKHQGQPQQPKIIKKKSRKKQWIVLSLLAILLISIFGVYMFVQGGNQTASLPNPTSTPTATPSTTSTSGPTKVLLHTSMGDITIQLRTDMPITTGNFVNLVKAGTYNGVIFHRVIPGFMIQGGDPTGTGYGDPKIPTIKDEFTSTNQNNRGTIAMANAGPNTGSSQFFINLVNNNYLDSKHPVFGTVVSGMDVAEKIANVPRDSNDKPLQNVTIITASILP
jgi:peptidylprolyl isomerase